MKTKDKIQNRPAQRDFGISIFGRLSGVFCRWHGGRLPETSPAQRHSKMSNLVLTPSPLRLILLSAQQYSIMSNLDDVVYEIITILIGNKTGFLTCGCDYEKQKVPAQRYSKMSNLKIETENNLPQRHSGMSILDFGGIASAEHSKQTMFIELIKNMAGCFGRLSGVLCWPHGRDSGNLLCQEEARYVGKVLRNFLCGIRLFPGFYIVNPEHDPARPEHNLGDDNQSGVNGGFAPCVQRQFMHNAHCTPQQKRKNDECPAGDFHPSGLFYVFAVFHKVVPLKTAINSSREKIFCNKGFFYGESLEIASFNFKLSG